MNKGIAAAALALTGSLIAGPSALAAPAEPSMTLPGTYTPQHAGHDHGKKDGKKDDKKKGDKKKKGSKHWHGHGWDGHGHDHGHHHHHHHHDGAHASGGYDSHREHPRGHDYYWEG